MSSDDSTGRSIVGTWRLVATKGTDPAGKPVKAPYGPRFMGLVTLTADKRMMAVLVDGRVVYRDGRFSNLADPGSVIAEAQKIGSMIAGRAGLSHRLGSSWRA